MMLGTWICTPPLHHFVGYLLTGGMTILMSSITYDSLIITATSGAPFLIRVQEALGHSQIDTWTTPHCRVNSITIPAARESHSHGDIHAWAYSPIPMSKMTMSAGKKKPVWGYHALIAIITHLSSPTRTRLVHAKIRFNHQLPLEGLSCRFSVQPFLGWDTRIINGTIINISPHPPLIIKPLYHRSQ